MEFTHEGASVYHGSVDPWLLKNVLRCSTLGASLCVDEIYVSYVMHHGGSSGRGHYGASLRNHAS